MRGHVWACRLEDAAPWSCPLAPLEPPSATVTALRRAYDRGARVVAFCSGSFALAAAGILDGRPATTHWMFADELARRHPTVHFDPEVLYVDDGQVSPLPGYQELGDRLDREVAAHTL